MERDTRDTVIELGYVPARIAKAAFGYKPEASPKQRFPIIVDTPMLDQMAQEGPNTYIDTLENYRQSLLQSNQQYVSKSVDGKSWIIGETVVNGDFQKYCFLVRRDKLSPQFLFVESAEKYEPVRDYLEGGKYGEWISIRKFMTQSASYYARKLDK